MKKIKGCEVEFVCNHAMRHRCARRNHEKVSWYFKPGNGDKQGDSMYKAIREWYDVSPLHTVVQRSIYDF